MKAALVPLKHSQVIRKILSLKKSLNMNLFEKSIIDIVTDVSEYGCYIGCIFSLVIAKNVLWMGRYTKLTFVNKMLILFYLLDTFTGMAEIYFLFKLKRER